MPNSRTIAVNGIELFLLEQGEGPLVLLCHGWPELSHSWRHQIPALAQAGFHVVAPDMRGFGRSSAPLDISAYSIFDTVGDMVALVSALGEKTAIIAGHDWYRNIDRNWELTAPWHGAQIHQPSLFIAGSADSVITGLIGTKRINELKRVLPNLTQKLIIEGAGHWIQQERPDEVNAALIAFVRGCVSKAQ